MILITRPKVEAEELKKILENKILIHIVTLKYHLF